MRQARRTASVVEVSYHILNMLFGRLNVCLGHGSDCLNRIVKEAHLSFMQWDDVYVA